MAVAEKVCKDCGKMLPLTDFYVKRAATGERQSYCKLCNNARAIKWQQDNADKVNELQREHYSQSPEYFAKLGLRRRAQELGFDPDEIEAYFESHNGLCDICKLPPEEREPTNRIARRLCIDHDHKTGKFRGLICRSCNLAIGNMNDDPKWLIAAADYLERS